MRRVWAGYVAYRLHTRLLFALLDAFIEHLSYNYGEGPTGDR